MLYPETLIEQAQKGDKQAFNRLANTWYPRIYNFAFKYFANDDIAMEVTQKTFITVFQKIHTLENTEKFKSWIYRIATNICHNEQKTLKRRSWFGLFRWSEEDKEEIPLPLADEQHQANPEKYIAEQQNIEILQKALNEINEDQRIVVIMKEYEGLKFNEIAEILGISENTAKARLYYGLNALRKLLESWNLSKEKLYYQ
jgi:RNA polymerase sigma factor (sigma-70 family)